MISKEDLYNKIMCKVSECVKNILDETFTTYPWTKVINYITKVQNELNIIIEQDSTQNNNLPSSWLNNQNFDDKKYIVYSVLFNSITNDNEYFEKIKNALQLVGLNYCKSYFENNKEYLIFLPKKQNSINLDIFKDLHFLYHICPHYVTEKILKNGFIPKAKNNLFNYDPRIHFFFPNTPIEEMKLIRQQLDNENKSKGNNHDYDIIKIEIPNNIKFYKDLDCLYGIYANENIDPKYIKEVKSIEGMSKEAYLNWQFKIMFPEI